MTEEGWTVRLGPWVERVNQQAEAATDGGLHIGMMSDGEGGFVVVAVVEDDERVGIAPMSEPETGSETMQRLWRLWAEGAGLRESAAMN